MIHSTGPHMRVETLQSTGSAATGASEQSGSFSGAAVGGASEQSISSLGTVDAGAPGESGYSSGCADADAWERTGLPPWPQVVPVLVTVWI